MTQRHGPIVFCHGADACNDQCEVFRDPGTYAIEATAPGYLLAQMTATTAPLDSCGGPIETKHVIVEMTAAP